MLKWKWENSFANQLGIEILKKIIVTVNNGKRSKRIFGTQSKEKFNLKGKLWWTLIFGNDITHILSKHSLLENCLQSKLLLNNRSSLLILIFDLISYSVSFSSYLVLILILTEYLLSIKHSYCFSESVNTYSLSSALIFVRWALMGINHFFVNTLNTLHNSRNHYYWSIFVNNYYFVIPPSLYYIFRSFFLQLISAPFSLC